MGRFCKVQQKKKKKEFQIPTRQVLIYCQKISTLRISSGKLRNRPRVFSFARIRYENSKQWGLKKIIPWAFEILCSFVRVCKSYSCKVTFLVWRTLWISETHDPDFRHPPCHSGLCNFTRGDKILELQIKFLQQKIQKF